MLTSPPPLFGETVAESYDVVYAGKETGAEVDLLVGLVRAHGQGRTARLLDLGCGTGRHSLALAARGFDVVGVDRSPCMLQRARAKAAALPAPPSLRFVQGDAASVEVAGPFDAVALLFTVLGYMITDDAVLATLRNAARHLRTGGLLVLDVWSEAAILRAPPAPRQTSHPVQGGSLVRRSVGTLDAGARTCRVDIEIERFDAGRSVHRAQESHQLRFFSPAGLARLLGDAGFEVLQLGAPPHVQGEPPPGEWTIWCVARKGPSAAQGTAQDAGAP